MLSLTYQDMKIALTGAGGMIGQSLIAYFSKPGVECSVLKRNGTQQEWSRTVSESDVVINLAGYPILSRWTRKNRERILESRIGTTRKLVEILNALSDDSAPKLLVSASATGIYPNDNQWVYDEYSKEKGNDFLAEVVEKWENTAKQLHHPSVRLVLARLGIVLSREGGFVKKLVPLFRMGLGGRLGSGKQKVSFIHIGDLLAAIQFFMDDEQASGVFNLVASEPVTNRELTRILAQVLKRPAFWIVPSWTLRLLLGKAAAVLLNSTSCVPRRLTERSFHFQFPTLQEALKDVSV